MADTSDLKSEGVKTPCGFESRRRQSFWNARCSGDVSTDGGLYEMEALLLVVGKAVAGPPHSKWRGAGLKRFAVRLLDAALGGGASVPVDQLKVRVSSDFGINPRIVAAVCDRRCLRRGKGSGGHRPPLQE